MARRMLIDASHPEETRVVVVDGTRLEEFDFETATRKPLKGNIYLAKVIRIEPSLQAAFVEYGGNRHGFLAFSEIHPDYYQIPIADRERLIAEQQRLAAEADEDHEPRRRGRVDRTDIEDARGENRGRSPGRAGRRRDAGRRDGERCARRHAGRHSRSNRSSPRPCPSRRSARRRRPKPLRRPRRRRSSSRSQPPPLRAAGPARGDRQRADRRSRHRGGGRRGAAGRRVTPEVQAAHDVAEEHREGDVPAEAADGLAGDPAEAPQPEVMVETLGGDDAVEQRETRERRRRNPIRQYKIQEVIKRRQILLVQVVKEERGNKGAALTTYLSLAGRYSVLMPNAGRGGGISRKISNPADRKRMKEVLGELDVPQGMGVILRTAGLERATTDIKRDYEYLSRACGTRSASSPCARRRRR